MKKKALLLVIFICSLGILLISLRLFWNMGVFVDEHNTTPAAVCGGEFWLMMDWLRMLLSGVTVVVSGIMLLRKE